MSGIALELTVNGEKRSLSISPKTTLLEVLREDLGLTGTKEGCGKGECGACTVLMDGKAVVSCLTLAAQAQGREIVTIEGIAQDGVLDPIQQAFIDEGAIQCGYCTPGMVLSAKALLLKNTAPSEEEIKVAISGNLCRCTGYTKIIRAIKKAAAVCRERAAIRQREEALPQVASVLPAASASPVASASEVAG